MHFQDRDNDTCGQEPTLQLVPQPCVINLVVVLCCCVMLLCYVVFNRITNQKVRMNHVNIFQFDEWLHVLGRLTCNTRGSYTLPVPALQEDVF